MLSFFLKMTLNKQILITFFTLIAAIIFFGISDVDTIVQDKLYNFTTHSWILDRNLQPYKFIFYTGFKKLLILSLIGILIALIFFRKSKIVREYKKGLLIVLLSGIFVPATVNFLKAKTNMPCPKNEIRYGGIYPKTAVWEKYQHHYKKRIKCWPAGHASGGFALMSLFFLFKRKRNKILGLLLGISLGWITGFYKMLIGDHFLSHTVITMILAWLIILINAKIVDKFVKEETN